MIFLRTIQNKQINKISTIFPFSVPIIKSLLKLEIKADVTILIGENGSGKSTFLEGLACSIGSISVGEQSVGSDPTLAHGRLLAESWKLTWNEKTKKGFFMRAEDFFQYTKKMNAMKAELEEEVKRVDREFKNRSKTAQLYARSGYAGQSAAIENRYGKDLDAHSHGEAFIDFFSTRFVPGGMYLLDEPEAPLSPLRQISFLMMIKEMVDKNSQFIIATHSPIIMAYPGAKIISFDGDELEDISYNQISSVKTMKNFLNHTETYLQHLNN
jgi:predicted ATPase